MLLPPSQEPRNKVQEPRIPLREPIFVIREPRILHIRYIIGYRIHSADPYDLEMDISILQILYLPTLYR